MKKLRLVFLCEIFSICFRFGRGFALICAVNLDLAGGPGTPGSKNYSASVFTVIQRQIAHIYRSTFTAFKHHFVRTPNQNWRIVA